MERARSKISGGEVVGFLALLALVTLTAGVPVPSSNEYAYLPLLYKKWHQNYLMGDWTYGNGWSGHLVFSYLFGLPSLAMSLEAIGWLGRVFCWVLIIVAALQTGRLFSLPPWMTTLSTALWLLAGQSFVGGEWIVGGFEAKCVSYVCLWFALLGIVNGRLKTSAVLLGASFSLHAGVGLWGGAATFVAMILMRLPTRQVAKAALITGACAVPGLIFLLPTVAGGVAGNAEDWKFLSLVRSPHHMDPFSWPLRDVLLVYLLCAFNWFVARLNRADGNLSFFAYFQAMLAVFFSLGLTLRWTENFQLLKFIPFRLLSVFVTLFFFLHVMRLLLSWRQEQTTHKALMAVALVGLMSLTNPFAAFADQVRQSWGLWHPEKDDIGSALSWVAANTRQGSTILSPPWRPDAFYLSQRAQVVNWRAVRYDELHEWRVRMERLCGPLEQSDVNTNMREKMQQHYYGLSQDDILAIGRDYHADYVMTLSDYNLPVVFASGACRVYLLPKAGRS